VEIGASAPDTEIATPGECRASFLGCKAYDEVRNAQNGYSHRSLEFRGWQSLSGAHAGQTGPLRPITAQFADLRPCGQAVTQIRHRIPTSVGLPLRDESVPKLCPNRLLAGIRCSRLDHSRCPAFWRGGLAGAHRQRTGAEARIFRYSSAVRGHAGDIQ